MLLARIVNDFDNFSFFAFQLVSSRVDLLRSQTREVLVRRGNISINFYSVSTNELLLLLLLLLGHSLRQRQLLRFVDTSRSFAVFSSFPLRSRSKSILLRRLWRLLLVFIDPLLTTATKSRRRTRDRLFRTFYPPSLTGPQTLFCFYTTFAAPPRER